MVEDPNFSDIFLTFPTFFLLNDAEKEARLRPDDSASSRAEVWGVVVTLFGAEPRGVVVVITAASELSIEFRPVLSNKNRLMQNRWWRKGDQTIGSPV